MPKITKNGTYDLKDSFKSIIEPRYSYTKDDADHLLVWTKCNSTSTLIDRSTMGRTVTESNLATVLNNTLYTQSYKQEFESVKFNGTNAQFNVPDSNDLSFTDGTKIDQSFSVSMWVRFADFSAIHGLFGKSTGSTTREYYGGVFTNGRVAFILYDETENASTYRYSAINSVIANKWHHIVFTYDGSNSHTGMKIYVDGELTTSSSAATSASYDGLRNVTSPLYVGYAYMSTANRYFKGDMGEFGLWSKKLSSNTVSALYHRKGYTAYESGYLNNPVRTLIRDRDNQTNTYPKTKRLGKPVSSYNQTAFNDTNSIKFGKRISDSFNIRVSQGDNIENSIDSSKWLVSNNFIKIRAEELNELDLSQDILPGALVLSHGGGRSRWIRTKDKVKNPTLEFSVILGPYAFNSARAMNLKRGDLLDTLAVQISKNGTTWEAVSINSGNVSNPIVSLTSGKLDATTPIYDSNIPLPINVDGYARPEFTVTMNYDQLRMAADHDASFYIRIVQDTMSDPYRAVWAINHIDIISREEQVVAQTGMIRSHSNLMSSSIASPNFISNIVTTGSGLIRNTDSLFLRNDENPTVEPFSDSRDAINPSKQFFKVSTPSNTYPGFSLPLSSKDIIEIDLSTATDTRVLGNPNNPGASSAVPAIAGCGSIHDHIMVYWNKDLKRWEKMGFPLSVNSHGATTTTDDIINILTSSAIGFSSYGVMVTGSGASSPDTTAKILPDSILNSYNRPTDTFGFPFSGRYHATSSQCITAKDIGITRPFVFEKAVLDFNLAYSASNQGGPGAASVLSQNDANKGSFDRPFFRNFTPSFFILAQHPGSFSTDIRVNTGSQGIDTEIAYTETIPGKFYLSSGSTAKTYVSDIRELVTYGQYSIVMSASSGHTSQAVIPNVTFEDLLLSPLVRDNHSVYQTNHSYHNITGSFRLEFPCRSTSRISAFAPYYVLERAGSAMGASALSGRSGYGVYANLRLGKQKSGRGFGGLASSNRSLVNGLGAFNPSDDVISIQYTDLPNYSGGAKKYHTRPVVTSGVETLDQPSPYVIFPEDKLVLGWQAPLYHRMSDSEGTANFPSAHMQLFGNSKLKMYGSFVKNGVEFHEGLNQNLTSNAVHEIIGAESIVDQFAIATREELTGSFYDDFPYANAGISAASVFGRNIAPYEVDVSLVDLNSQKSQRVGSKGRVRIGTPVFSLNNASSFGTTQASFSPQIGSNVSIVDDTRTFLDARLSNLDAVESFKMYVANDKNTIPATYGSMQNIYATSIGGQRRIRFGGAPKYLFSGKHYGQYIDFIKQGHDGAFVDNPLTNEDNIVVDPAVKIEFVESHYSTDVRGMREYSLIQPGDIDGTAYQQFQSSNISKFATSSLPFFDQAGNDGLLRSTNRTYGRERVEIT